MSSVRKIDSWGNASATYDGNVCIELVRSAHVIDITGPDAMMDAVETSGIPLPWEAFPGRTNMRVLNYSVEPTSGQSANVLIRYINQDYKKVRDGQAPEIVQRDYDLIGTQITQVWQGQTYVGVVNAFSPRPIKIVQRIEPQPAYGGADINLRKATYEGAIVGHLFFTYNAGFWFCESIEAESIGTVAYDVTYTFRGRVGGWNARTIPEDEQGRPLAGAPAQYTQIYPIGDFTSLDLEP